jgi:hypothetical protein
MDTTYQNLRQRAKGLYAAGLAAIVLGSLLVIAIGSFVASPLFFVTNPLRAAAFLWFGLILIGLGFTWLISGLITASMAVSRAAHQVPGTQYPTPPWVQQH